MGSPWLLSKRSINGKHEADLAHRKTFASTSEYFEGKNPAGQFQILDFGTTLLGREEQIRALDDFAKDDRQRVCILSGRGGIGKSKILHDWANSNPTMPCLFEG